MSALKRDTAVALLSLPNLMGANLVAQAVVIWLSAQESLFPGADVFHSIVTTCSEIIAGLYGTTLAGYTFFLSRIDALMASDTTLDYVAANIKRRFKYLIWYISFNVLVTLFISIVLMYVPVPTGGQSSYFYRLFCNEFVLFLGFSIVLILYYSVSVVNPKCVEKEAAKLKRRLCRRGPAGSTAEFITLYDRIETVCNNLIPAAVLNQIYENKGKRFAYTIDLLREQNTLKPPLLADISRIHHYYECMINSAPLCVDDEMCILAKKVLTFLSDSDVKKMLKNK